MYSHNKVIHIKIQLIILLWSIICSIHEVFFQNGLFLNQIVHHRRLVSGMDCTMSLGATGKKQHRRDRCFNLRNPIAQFN